MITAAFYIISIIGIVLLSLFTYARRTEKGGIYFSLMTLSISLLLFSQFVAIQFPKYADLIINIGLIFFSFIPFYLYKFSYFFVYTNPKSKNFVAHQVFSYVALGLMIVLSLSPDAVTDARVVDGSIVIDSGWAYLLQSVVGLIIVLYSLALLAVNYRKLSKTKKLASKNFAYGIGVAVAGNLISGLFFANISSIQFLGPLSVLLMSAFVTYSITKHHLFDIRSAVIRTVGYTLTISIFVLLFSFFTTQLSSRFIDEPGLQGLINAFMFIIFVLLQKPTRQFIDKATNFIFYRDAYDPEQVLNELGKILADQINLESIMQDSIQLIGKNLKIDKLIFIVLGEENKIYKVKSLGGFSAIKSLSTELTHSKFKDKVTVKDQLQEGKIKKHLSKNNLEVVLRLESADETVGFIVLGQKLSGSFYTKQDIRFLDIVAKQMAIATQNARYFNQIAEFNETLQKKIKDATAKLEKTNQKLKELDSAKDEFISMASHQLRTPLTTIKGYLSMVLEGDAGKLNKDQHKFVDQAFGSAQRMVYLIADLLNVSRLNTGKFVIDATETNLADLVQQEVDQLQRHAESRKMELTYKKPAKFPLLMLDETKTRQVIMNFTDNALYYTPEGGKVKVAIRETPTAIEFTVTDNGIGVPRELQHKLFSKFYRADNAKQARPDGTGLGLFMAKKVIVAQGGAVIFKSKVGLGSTFGFSFPKKKILVKK